MPPHPRDVVVARTRIDDSAEMGRVAKINDQIVDDAACLADTLRGFPALTELIASRYAKATTIEDFDVYLEQP